MDISQIKPIKVNIQEEEAIWKDNHLPAVDLNQRKDILIPTEIHMQSSKGKSKNLSLFCIAALICSQNLKDFYQLHKASGIQRQ